MGSNCKGFLRTRSLRCWVASLTFSLSGVWITHAQTQLPEGPGRAVTERMCTSCHGVEQFTGMRMTKQRWAETVDDMVARGAQGSDADINQVVQYLTDNFGGGKIAALPESVMKAAGASAAAGVQR